MLRAAGSALLLRLGGVEQRLAASACSYATQAADYSLAMKTANEVTKPALPIPDKEIGLCAGVPVSTYTTRKALISTSARSAGQQALGNTVDNTAAPQWKIEFENLSKWVNPLMGWTSSADPLENTARASLRFYTKEEALAFCAKHGWEAEVEEPNPRDPKRPKRFLAYGDNYSIKRKGVPDLSTQRSNQK